MGGCGEGRVRRERLEHVDAQTVGVDRHRNDLEAVGRELLAAGRAGGVLHPDAPGALGDQCAGDQRHPLSHPGRDDHALGVAGHAAHPAEVADERHAQLGRSARVAVVEAGVGGVPERAPQRGQPGGAREQRHVGAAGPEVEARRPLGGGATRRAGRGRGRLGDARGGALARDQVPLGAELGVGVHDHAPRNAQVARESTRRGQRDAGRQPAGPDGLAQLLLELRAQRDGAAADAYQQVGAAGHAQLPQLVLLTVA